MSIAVLGEALIDLIERDGVFHPLPGGSLYNVAIGLARQDMNVSYLSPLSKDQLGTLLYDNLIAEGVNLPAGRRSELPTSLSLIKLDSQGAPTYTLYRQGVADKDTTSEQIIADLPADLQIFHTGSLAITPSQLSRTFDIFEHLRRNNVLISVDINIRSGASSDQQAYIAGVISLLEYCDIVKASDEDLLALNLAEDPLRAGEIVHQKMNNGLLLLTEGKGGAWLFTQDQRVRRDSYPVDRLVDTVGAGDTFHSAFLTYLLRQGIPQGGLSNFDTAELKSALDYACAAAAINVSRTGCSPPTTAEIEKFISDFR
ncbi:MAG: hypothetical protein KDI36_05950 [Pseudomonadales bacterium]|nr:hypothetical protein [Pseudomonadales bacterium]